MRQFESLLGQSSVLEKQSNKQECHHYGLPVMEAQLLHVLYFTISKQQTTLPFGTHPEVFMKAFVKKSIILVSLVTLTKFMKS